MTSSSWFCNKGKERVQNDAYDNYGGNNAAYACNPCLYDGQQCGSGERCLLYGNNDSREMAWGRRGKEHPRMSKNNGYDGTVYNIGAFNVSGYGKCRTYVCLKTKPAIIVRTQDKTYLLNDESEAGTRELYDRLVEACGKGVQ